MRTIEVVTYDENWMSLYSEEAEKLRDLLKEELIDIHHIGSTSIIGMKAKPVIDILSVVKDINQIDLYNDQMIAIGFLPKGENGIPGRRYFQKGGDLRTHHLHLFQQGNQHIERHLAFRDYLRAHPDMMLAYGNLKEELARKYRYDVQAYIEGKHDFVQQIEKKALVWYRKRESC